MDCNATLLRESVDGVVDLLIVFAAVVVVVFVGLVVEDVGGEGVGELDVVHEEGC